MNTHLFFTYIYQLLIFGHILLFFLSLSISNYFSIHLLRTRTYSELIAIQ